MIRVMVRRDETKSIRSVEVTGHANFAEPGSEDKTEGGYFYVETYPDVSPEDMTRTQLLLEGMLVQLDTIAHSYGDYIQIEQ